MPNKGKHIKGKKIVPPGYSSVSGCTPPDATKFKPGQSGNPKGRPTAGASVKEWLNMMARWDMAKTSRVVDDPDAPNAKVLAALIWREACAAGGANFDRIMDRTEPKPVQALDLTSGGDKLNIEVIYRNKIRANDPD